jgi:hypothetical protein
LLGFACNPQTGFIWMRVGPTGLWNNSSTANPATGVGGIAIPAPLSVTNPGIVVSGTLFQPGNTVTGNFTQASFVGTAPTGFSALGASFASIIPAMPTGVVAGTPFTFTGSLQGFAQPPTLTLSINGAAPIAMTGVTTSGWSESLTVPSSGPITIVVSGGGVTGSVSFFATGTTTTLPPPAIAAAVGFTTLTFGPNIVLGTDPTLNQLNGNMVPFNPYGVEWAAAPIANTNSDGSIEILPNAINGYGAQLCTAAVNTTTGSPWMRGIAFGGGCYVQAVMAWTWNDVTGGPALWANDIQSMMASSAGDLTRRQWQGQPIPYGNWIEWDVFEEDPPGSGGALNGQAGFAIHNWFGVTGEPDVSTNESGSTFTLPAGTDFTKPNTYGGLWVPATSTTQGFIKWYFNGQQIGNTIYWDQYNPNLAPPPVDLNQPPNPPGAGSSAYSRIDACQLAFILGNANVLNGVTPSNVQVFSLEVWQGPGANNVAIGNFNP